MEWNMNTPKCNVFVPMRGSKMYGFLKINKSMNKQTENKINADVCIMEPSKLSTVNA
jgi:hypothetical protein